MKYAGHPTPQGKRVCSRYFFILEGDFAYRGRQQQSHDPEQGGFSRAIRAKDSKDFSFEDIESRDLKHNMAAMPDLDIAQR